MAAHTHVAVGYNVQIAVDAKHKLIVEQQVTNQVVDMGLLAQTAEPTKEVLAVERIAVVADRGYFKIEDIEEGLERDKSREGNTLLICSDQIQRRVALEAIASV
jgi:Transposase DDE domain